MAGRLDAMGKATGAAVYTADVQPEGTAHVAVVRSAEAHARLVAIDTGLAESMPGVVGVFTAADVTARPYGRRVRDIPVLARDKVRFLGERVAAVVAETPRQAQRAAEMVEVTYADLPTVTDPAEAVQPSAPAVHEAPWGYANAVITPGDGHNLQSCTHSGDETTAEERLAACAHVVDRTYTTHSSHQGYIEPQACVVAPRDDGGFDVWATEKAPYRLREEAAVCVGLDPAQVRVHPATIGGDFGGKGGYGNVMLCLELARLTGRPVKSVTSYAEDLTATNPRHAARIRVRLGCDAEGTLQALWVDALVDGGAYAGFKPTPTVSLRGIDEIASCYRIPAIRVQQRVVSTTSVPRGHVRAPGRPEATFALESALDELAAAVGVGPVQLRRRNLVATGDANCHGVVWVEARAGETLQSAVDAADAPPPAPQGWWLGKGIAISEHATPATIRTSLRLTEQTDGTLHADVPIAETGTGSHTVVREALARGLDVARDRVHVRHVSTSELAFDLGVGASRVTAALSVGIERLLAAWRARGDQRSVTVDVDAEEEAPVTSFCAQVAWVAVHPETGQVAVLELVTAVDVAEIINPAAHRMQIDGGAAMGFGFACLEDLQIEDGQVWAANLGEFKIPSTRDMPALRTVLVPGATGVGWLNTKGVGELSNVPTAAAIANAVTDATGVRLVELPVRAEAVWQALRHRRGAPTDAAADR